MTNRVTLIGDNIYSKKGNKRMIDKIIDVLGFMLIGFLAVYAVCFYVTELIRIIF